jgi:hypothetical protein
LPAKKVITITGLLQNVVNNLCAYKKTTSTFGDVGVLLNMYDLYTFPTMSAF